MKIVEKIKYPIKDEMNWFEDKFKLSMSSSVPLLDRITYYIVRRKGKQMRPMFVFLTAKAISGEVSEKAYRAASLIELLHTATLVHDDVVDDSNMRRGFFSLNALWKNKIAVLVGDFLLSKGLLLSVQNKDYDLLEVVSNAVKEMSEGELLQIEKARKLDITEDVYFDIIKKKTATLISACTAAGAISAGADEKLVADFLKFGELIGIAFQMKDDLFDYTEDKIGKPTGIDIKEQKMTLPLIYTLNKVNKERKKWIINIVKNQNNNKKKVKELIEFVNENGGLEYTSKKMKEYQENALEILKNIPDSTAKESLITLVNYVIARNI